MPDVKIIPDPDCEGSEDRGKRGKRGHAGPTGPTGGSGTGAGPTGPTGPTTPSGTGLLQTRVADIVADTTIPGGGFALLPPLTIPIVISAGSALLIHFTVSGLSNTDGNSTFFRLRVDGVVVKGASFSRATGGGRETAAIVAKITGLAAGAHTVDIQANTTGISTTGIFAATQPNVDHGTLLVEEVNV